MQQFILTPTGRQEQRFLKLKIWMLEHGITFESIENSSAYLAVPSARACATSACPCGITVSCATGWTSPWSSCPGPKMPTGPQAPHALIRAIVSAYRIFDE